MGYFLVDATVVLGNVPNTPVVPGCFREGLNFAGGRVVLKLVTISCKL